MRKEAEARLRELMEKAVENELTAGISLCVRQNNQEVFFWSAGFADREQKRPIDRNTIFRLYSMSKPLTAAGAMILMEQGKLDFGEPVSEYLPGFARENEKERVTVFDLLQMTSGLGYGSMESAADQGVLDYLNRCIGQMDTEKPVTTREFTNHLGELPFLFEPGASWHYGFSADVLGAVVEAASGMPFGKFMEESLFGPLGMKDTGFWVPPKKQERLAKSYERTGDGRLIPYTGCHLMIQNRMEKPPLFESGGAGIVSTMEDYARFAQMLMNRGVLEGNRILKPETVKYFISGGLTFDQQREFEKWKGLEGYTYSHLLRIMEKPERASMIAYRGEYGWDGWLGCHFANIPVRNMTILVMQQKKDAGTTPLIRKMRNVILSDLPEA